MCVNMFAVSSVAAVSRLQRIWRILNKHHLSMWNKTSAGG